MKEQPYITITIPTSNLEYTSSSTAALFTMTTTKRLALSAVFNTTLN